MESNAPHEKENLRDLQDLVTKGLLLVEDSGKKNELPDCQSGKYQNT